MYSGIGEAFKELWFLMVALLAITVPLGVWKLVEIILYLNNNLHIQWGLK